jgi:hypothetical protein
VIITLLQFRYIQMQSVAMKPARLQDMAHDIWHSSIVSVVEYCVI